MLTFHATPLLSRKAGAGQAKQRWCGACPAPQPVVVVASAGAGRRACAACECWSHVWCPCQLCCCVLLPCCSAALAGWWPALAPAQSGSGTWPGVLLMLTVRLLLCCVNLCQGAAFLTAFKRFFFDARTELNNCAVLHRSMHGHPVALTLGTLPLPPCQPSACPLPAAPRRCVSCAATLATCSATSSLAPCWHPAAPTAP